MGDIRRSRSNENAADQASGVYLGTRPGPMPWQTPWTCVAPYVGRRRSCQRQAASLPMWQAQEQKRQGHYQPAKQVPARWAPVKRDRSCRRIGGEGHRFQRPDRGRRRREITVAQGSRATETDIYWLYPNPITSTDIIERQCIFISNGQPGYRPVDSTSSTTKTLQKAELIFPYGVLGTQHSEGFEIIPGIRGT